ncbi:MAG: ISKra4 family transposase [Gallionellaceae bacterium]|nr:ISKra4 family transposase [Gallionellaceae bacterium]
MTFNSQEIIQDVRAEFEHLLGFVTGEQARTAKADHIERGLFKMLLKLGAKLLQLFFTMRSEICSRQAVQSKNGQVLPYHRDTDRIYFSIFNKVFIKRPYFYKQGVGAQIPLDAELGLGDDRYSDLLRETTEHLAVYHVYGGPNADFMERLFGFSLSTRALQQNVAEDSESVEAYYAQKPPPSPESEAEILVIQADGKGIPMVLEEDEVPETQARLGKGQKHGHKKEAIVTTIYTIPAAPRTPSEVIASFFKENQPKTRLKKDAKPKNKCIWATLDGKDVALSRLSIQVALRESAHVRHRVALCDGCEALQSRIVLQFQGFILILDFVHANEYLWDVANSLLGEASQQRLEWVKNRTLQILSGQTEQVIAELRQIAKNKKTKMVQRKQLHKTANYFERNLPYMDYQTYLAKGYPIASGAIEGACRHFVKDRFELSGMRWLQTGAENLLRLRAVAENDDWDAYYAYRRQQRQLRLYGQPVPNMQALEAQAINSQPVLPAFVSNSRAKHSLLPLAV